MERFNFIAEVTVEDDGHGGRRMRLYSEHGQEQLIKLRGLLEEKSELYKRVTGRPAFDINPLDEEFTDEDDAQIRNQWLEVVFW